MQRVVQLFCERYDPGSKWIGGAIYQIKVFLKNSLAKPCWNSMSRFGFQIEC
jgi:hypothetical protein